MKIAVKDGSRLRMMRLNWGEVWVVSDPSAPLSSAPRAPRHDRSVSTRLVRWDQPSGGVEKPAPEREDVLA
jgi:hypothetical protein